MNNDARINSDPYWNERFARDWVECGGPRQSVFFAQLAIGNLPSWLLDQIKRHGLTLVDWGCAQGDGTDVWAGWVRPGRLFGVDFSDVAIDQASNRYPAIAFECANWLLPGAHDDRKYDIVFSSNTLEHFANPYAVLEEISTKADKAIVLALPYQELNRIAEHFYSFFPDNIPLALGNGFRLAWSRVVNCRAIPSTLWSGDQIILVYASPRWAESLNLLLSDCQIQQIDSHSQIADLNQAVAERDGQIASLNQAVAERDGQINGLTRALVELRCEAGSLFKAYQGVLGSRSFRVTRPLRAMARVVRHGHPDAAGQWTVYRLAAHVGRTFPFPLWMKARIRAALVPRMAARAVPTSENRSSVAGADLLSAQQIAHEAVPGPRSAAMQPGRCGLVEDLVSVVLPVYNQATLLAESIDSVLGQTYENFELIVINDGSTDGVEEVLAQYIEHPKVRCYTQANQRLPRALSNGFSYARGEFWTWTSADNIMEPRMLESLVAKLRSDATIGMVYADYYAIDDRGAILQDPTWRAHNRPDPRSGAVRLPHTTETLNVVQDNFIGPCFMYRGWIGRCLGDYDTTLGIEDYDYWMRINAFFKIRHLGKSDLLYRYRVHDNTLSAHAQEHKILEKVQRLMAYEEERATAYAKPVSYLADARAADWLRLNDVAQENIVEWNMVAGDDGLIVIASETAIQHSNVFARLNRPIAVIVDHSNTNYDKLGSMLLSGHCLVLAQDAVSAQRVRVIAPVCPMVDASSAMSLTAVRAFSRNLLFIQKTRSAEDRRRVLPEMLIPRQHHVLLQVDSFIQGGMENVVIDLALSLRENGWRVTIANLGKSGDAAAKAAERGLPVVPLAADISDSAYASFLRERGVDLVNAHYSCFGAAICSRLEIPFVQTVHNSYVWFDHPKIQQYRQADAHTDAYVCVSRSAARYADVVVGIDVGKMRVIPNGIDPQTVEAAQYDENRASMRQAWCVQEGAPVFLNVASIMATKAQLSLAKAFARVAEDLPSARLVFLGAVMELTYQREIEKFIRKHNLQDKVIFAGYDRKVSGYYHGADVFVLPSHWEGWSLSLAEAMVNGLSCVITDVGSSYEFESAENCEVIAPAFGDIVNLNHENLGRFVYGDDTDFVRRLAQAMRRAAAKPRSPVNTALAERLANKLAYRGYAELFGSLL